MLEPDEPDPDSLLPPLELESFEDGSLSGMTASTAPTTVPAAVATTAVTLSATEPTRSATRRTADFACRRVGIFLATFFAAFIPRRAIPRMPPPLRRPRARDDLRVLFFVVFLVAFFVAFLVLFLEGFLLDFFVDFFVDFLVDFFLAMPAPCEVARAMLRRVGSDVFNRLCQRSAKTRRKFDSRRASEHAYCHARFSRCRWMSPALSNRWRIRLSFSPRMISFTTRGCSW